MKHSPPPKEHYNYDLLDLIPNNKRKIIEIGCSNGALGGAYKQNNQECFYVGIDIIQSMAESASIYCDAFLCLDIEQAGDEFFQFQNDADCWVFGDSLEHLIDPWGLLKKIRKIIPSDGCIVACIPNAQHWSFQFKLLSGDLRYEDQGLFDRTHLRWFTRQTIIEMFSSTGFSINTMNMRVFNEPDRDVYTPLIGEIARSLGIDPKQTIQDATPLQYVLLATPI